MTRRGLASVVAVLATLGVLVLATGPAGWAQGKWEAPADAKKLKNPLKPSKKVTEAAEKIVKTNCVPCHGAKGKGDGPAAAALPVKPADWTSAALKSESDGELYWKITNGRGPMPPWKHLSDQDRWAVVLFIRSLQK